MIQQHCKKAFVSPAKFLFNGNQFYKEVQQKHIISCKRTDGTFTWMHHDLFFITHDLCHYAVETGLNLKRSFYGILAKGADINDFELPREKRTTEFTREAIWTEQMVNLLTIECSQGKMENFIDVLNEVYSKNNIVDAMPEINYEKLDQIRHSLEKLMNQWHLLPEDQTMSLIF